MNGQRLRQPAGLLPIAFFACLSLGTAASFAADPPPADSRLDALLSKVEQQIADGHAMGPDDDNALDTWAQVITMRPQDTPAAATAIQRFALDMRSRATTELTAGKVPLSVNYSVFARMAEDYIKRANEPRPAADPQSAMTAPGNGNPRETTPNPAPPPPKTGGDAPVPQPDPRASPADAAAVAPAPPAVPPLPATPNPVSDPPAPPPAPRIAVARAEAPAAAPAPSIAGAPGQVHQDQAAAALYTERGDAMMAVKDITAARKLYEFAANAGSARAASALAATYDPAGLRRLGAIGLRPNPDLAALWYRRAEALGDQGAVARLNSLAHEAQD